MNIFEKYNITPLKAFKFAGIVIVALFVLLLIGGVVLGSLNTARQRVGGLTMVDQMNSYGGGMYAPSAPMGSSELSVRNVSGTTGNTAEDFEVSDYSANIETTQLRDTCSTMATLKARTDVIFESANESDKNCYYRFKVARASVVQVLAFIKDLDPKSLVENTFTIKNQIDDYTSETEILKRKLATIDSTLTNALAAYDDITSLAVKTQNAEALARIIDSKIQTIERLTNERLSTSAQLERLARAKAQELDRIDYTYFSVQVFENTYFDLKAVRASWKQAIQDFVLLANLSLQRATVGVGSFILFILPLVIYLLIVIILAKYGWQFTKYVWRKRADGPPTI